MKLLHADCSLQQVSLPLRLHLLAAAAQYPTPQLSLSLSARQQFYAAANPLTYLQFYAEVWGEGGFSGVSSKCDWDQSHLLAHVRMRDRGCHQSSCQ